jgi:hypothetical protein
MKETSRLLWTMIRRVGWISLMTYLSMIQCWPRRDQDRDIKRFESRYGMDWDLTCSYGICGCFFLLYFAAISMLPLVCTSLKMCIGHA